MCFVNKNAQFINRQTASLRNQRIQCLLLVEVDALAVLEHGGEGGAVDLEHVEQLHYARVLHVPAEAVAATICQLFRQDNRLATHCKKQWSVAYNIITIIQKQGCGVHSLTCGWCTPA